MKWFLKKYSLSCLAFTLLVLTAFTFPPKHITVYLIGDSTMSVKEKKAYPETGWGMPFVAFMDSTVTIDNRARNGRSTKTFITEGLWQPVADHVQAGDYVLIQFGHNDEVKTKASYATESEFTANLNRFVNEVRSKKAIPILLTPVARRKFDAGGKIEDTHTVYAQLVRDVAAKNNITLIDLDKLSMDMLHQYGPETSKLLFNHLTPGEHPNYPDGKQDDTHFSELGARKVAELVLAEIRKVQPDLAEHIVKPKSVIIK
ncbi:rhamnogalacturonan acetylesterase [Mucilaginibacter robiniae]|uniref:Rhamnogalacturonan acetylesterase n=1 Tax=Mucilaginibacter robiniae TaxID=2728022 RepID=A0A7L5DX75_9SPHI|nr:rhamnogalacturonan acetylesterase [Mucilaginibacter robiniae]QJD94599.1 rhamnogalacturonan acetylesterase [Mucilaginibacter robiniae]